MSPIIRRTLSRLSPRKPASDSAWETLHKVRGWNSLKFRIAAGSVFFLGASALILSAYVNATLRSQLETHFAEQQFSTVAVVASYVDGQLGERMRVLEKEASLIAAMGSPALLQGGLETDPELEMLFNAGFFVTDAQGNVVASHPDSRDRRGLNFMDQDYLRTILREGRAATSSPFVGRRFKHPMIAMGTPIRGAHGEVLGAFVGSVDLGEKTFLDSLSGYRFGNSGEYFLVDPRSRLVIAATDKSRVMSAYPAPGVSEGVDRILAGRRGWSTYRDANGAELLSSSQNVPTSGWVVHTALPTREAYAPLTSVEWRVVLAALLLAGIGGALRWVMIGRQFAPMFEAARKANELSRSDEPPQPIEVRSHDEVGQLVMSFNRLIASLTRRDTALRESERRYAAAFSTTPDVVAILRSDDLRFLDVNPSFSALTGWTRDEAVGRTTRQLGLWSSNDQQRQLFEVLDRDRRCVDFEAEFVMRDGTSRMVLMFVQTIEIDHEPCILTICRDITRRKASERRLRELNRLYSALIQCNHAIVHCATESELLERVCRILVEVAGMKLAWVGRVELPDTRVRPVAAFGDGADDIGTIDVSIDESVEAGRGPTGRCLRARAPEWCQDFDQDPGVGPSHDRARKLGIRSVAALPLLRNETVFGSLTMYSGALDSFDDEFQRLLAQMAADVALAMEKFREEEAGWFAQAELDRHRHHLEELVGVRTRELVDARRLADAANVAKSTFIANMSHEIRTPINAVVGLTYLLRRDGITGTQSTRVEQIEQSTQHLLALVNDILDISKIEAGRLELEATDFALREIVESVAKLVAPQAEAKRIALSCDCGNLPRRVRGDPTRLRQALMNYASNAVKFCERGRVWIRCAVAGHDAGGVTVRFEVGDTGIGIAPERLPLLFREFEQGDKSTTRNFGGTGLGLAITKHLAEMMGGEAGAASTPGVGSTFWFTAKLSQPVDAERATPVASVDALELLRQRFARARVLVAEDNPISAGIVGELLRDAHLVADCAPDGAAAVALAREHAYDVVLMDLQLPRMDGIQATHAIRALPGWHATPIIALTANIFAEDRRRCLEAGMDDFLGKPMRPQDLYSMLAKWLCARSRGAEPPAGAASGVAGPAVERSNVLERVAAIPGMDRERVLGFRSNVAKYVELLNDLVIFHGDDMDIVEASVAAREWERARKIAHSLKGAAAMLGPDRLSAMVARLEAALGAAAPPRKEIARLAKGVRAELAGLAAALADLRQPPPSAGAGGEAT